MEAGATRNFEALSKAEKQAELDEKAYQEEIKLNPMKLLEERTEASKNEMERMEALEELHELNKRNLKNELPDEMLAQYQKLQEVEVDEVEKQDEEFIKSVFGKDGDNRVIKRIVDEDDECEVKTVPAKLQKIERPTDLLANNASEKEKKNSWEKSIGTMSNKSKLKGLIVKRKTDKLVKSSCSDKTTESIKNESLEHSNATSSNISTSFAESIPKSSSSKVLSTTKESSSNALGSLGLDYSDTDSD